MSVIKEYVSTVPHMEGELSPQWKEGLRRCYELAATLEDVPRVDSGKGFESIGQIIDGMVEVKK